MIVKNFFTANDLGLQNLFPNYYLYIKTSFLNLEKSQLLVLIGANKSNFKLMSNDY